MKRLVLLLTLAGFCVTDTAGQSNNKTINSFLGTHPESHLLTLDDLPEWKDDQEYVAQFNPITRGDANRDGRADLAAIFVRKSNGTSLFSLICFHGLPRGFSTNPIWVIKDSGEQILNAKIYSNPPELFAWFCFHCDVATPFSWKGNRYVIRGANNAEATLTAKEQPTSIPNARNIRQVDFSNFTFPTSLCGDAIGLGKTVTVKNGDFKRGSGDDEAYFSSLKPLYGDITGDGDQEAVVHNVCGESTWNYGLDEFLVYTMREGQVVLLGELNGMVTYYRHYYPNGTLWSPTDKGLRIQGGSVAVDWYADGPHCCPKYIATLAYRWNGKQLILSGRPQRRVFKQ